ncbi:PIR Superfamily Protein [Plasmodium ovale curtisi]|uniref:PIR Superfamily Protein n=1 Tax=Plasmodium ovale curtisi TaxID=864141 RepID=A0A1A8X9N3_PLAOA|nr:PIR Superfamily Protein [Plasmodium ovale curtisi]
MLHEIQTKKCGTDEAPAIIYGCDDFSDLHINIPTDNFPKFCSTTIKFLNHLKENSHVYRDEGCKYLYYSLYVEILRRQTSFENTIILYKKLNKIFNDHNDGFNTLDNYISTLNLNTSNNLAKLIDIYKKFDKFERNLDSTPSIEKCIGDCIQLFKDYLNEYKKGYDYDFCYELKIFREKYNTFIKKVIKYEGEQYLLPPFEMFDTGHMIIIPFLMILVAAFIFPILYKFTTFGPWILHTLGMKKNILKNINEKARHSMNNYNMKIDKSKKLSYNVAYNSS